MNVLESLKINNATILDLKDGDILFIKLTKDTTLSEMNNIREGFEDLMKSKNLKNVDLVIGNSIEDIKIIRR